MLKVIKYILLDILKSRFINGYMITLFIIAFGLFNITHDSDKGVLGISNVLLILIPLISIVFTSSNIYNSVDFIRLLLTQPISRSSVFFSHYIAVTLSLLYAFIIGIGIPLIIYGNGEKIFTLLISGIALTIIFTSIAFLISFKISDKVKGIGILLLCWLYFVVVYDGIMMLIVKAMSDYPVEQYSIILITLNPIDLCRILIMFNLDISVLMGLTGAVLQTYLGTFSGTLIITACLLLWAVIPILVAGKIFIRKNF